MKNKKEKMLSAVRLWTITQSMEEITDDIKYTYWTDIAFKKDDKIYGFITEFDKSAEKLKLKSSCVRDYCDYVYIVTDDTRKRKYIVDNTINKMGILCFSDSFGLGSVYQVLQEPKLLL